MLVAQAESFSAPNSAQRAKGATSVASAHGSSGPVQVTFPDLMYGGPQQPAFATAMTKLGLAKSDDINGGQPNAVSFTPDVRLSSSLSLSLVRRANEGLFGRP